jgi:ATP-dependent Clp endopeptidase proteolytic subunit ClpP
LGDILLYGDLGCIDAGLDAGTLVELIGQSSGDLHVRINSPGGFIIEGLAIYNALVRAKNGGRRVIVHIDGLAASMASVVAMAGDEIIMADTALMMIHNPLNGAYGDAAELRKAADQLDALRDQLLRIYQGRTGLSVAVLTAMLDAETWMTAEEALKKRFITSIVAANTAVNSIDLKPFGFRKAPAHPLIAAQAIETTRTAAAAPNTQEHSMDEETSGAPTPSPTPAPTPTPTPSPTPTPTVTTAENRVTDAKAIAAQAVAAERTRASTIRSAVAKAQLPAAFAEELVDAGTSIDDARAQIIDKLADASEATMPRNQAPIAVGTEAREKFVIGAGNALLARAGLTGIVAAAAKIRGETIDLDPGEFRGIRNVELARMALDMAGIGERSYDRDRIVARALTARNSVYQTTSDFPTILENTMHKVLQAAYAVAPDTWSRVCGIGSVTDFRPHNRYLRGTFGELPGLNENGEFKNLPIPDAAKEQISATTKGAIIGLSRQAIVNDDMDAFSGLAVDFGRASKLSIEIAFYRLLAMNDGLGPIMNDGKTFFHADHGNIADAAAPSVVAFDALRVLMARQKDLSKNEYLDIRPASWLGPIELGGTVRTLNDAVYDPDTANKLQKPNMVRGLFSDIVDTPRLSGTPWYGFADKDTAPAFEVVFLNGEQEPFLESKEGWRTDGTEWKVRHDFGVGGVNYRSAARNAGHA